MFNPFKMLWQEPTPATVCKFVPGASTNAQLQLILERITRMSGTLEDLRAQVTANTSVVGSAIALIRGFAAKLAAAGTDPAALTALRDELASSDQALADAVAANTPQA